MPRSFVAARPKNQLMTTLMLLLLGTVIMPLVVHAEIPREPLIEPERMKEYHRRGYTYPLVDYVPNTTGWRALMEERFAQVDNTVVDPGRRYEAFYQVMNTAWVVPNFTEYGFGLARAPAALTADLQQGIRDGLPTAGIEPMDDGVINGKEPPWMIHRPDLTNRVLHELLPYAEEWAGIKLKPHQAYGFRLYRNESQLLMHVDRMQVSVQLLLLVENNGLSTRPF